jgi:hypothetical protein
VVVVDDVLVAPPQGQSRGRLMPTATLRQWSASEAFSLKSPFTSQIQKGMQSAIPTPAFKMNRQSVAVGSTPNVTG